MPIDYSKWDNIELSDDSDIEVHPNVDKKSFIKWKQQDIHQKRLERNREIQQYEIQIPMYEELNVRANKMLADLSDEDLGDLNKVKQYLSKTFDNGKPANPTLSAEDFADQPTYSEMIEDLFIQLKGQLRDAKKDPNDGANLRTEIINHHKKINDVLAQNKAKLVQLNKEKELQISSEDMHTGWDRSFLNKNDADAAAAAGSAKENQQPMSPSSSVPSAIASPVESESTITQPSTASTTLTQSTSKPSVQQSTTPVNTQGKVQEVVEEHHGDEDEGETAPQVHPDTVKLSLISTKDHQKICDFLSNHTYIITPQQKDALLMTAFDAQLANEPTRTKQIIYHSCMIQYVLDIMNYQKTSNPYQVKIIVQQLFKNIFNGKASNAALTALDTEVTNTFNHIKKRCEILSQQDEEEDDDEHAQIQLKSLDDNAELKVDIPTEKDSERYEAFTTLLPSKMQEAMKTGSLDEVNKVFAEIPYKEAELILEVFQDYEFISVQEGVIEDEAEWKEIHEQYHNNDEQELSSKVQELDVEEPEFVSTADIID